MITVRETKEIPTEEHYAALIDESFTYDDGYGDRGSSSTSTHRSVRYVVLGNIEQATKWVHDKDDESSRKYGSRDVFRIIKVTPLAVDRQVSIRIS